MNEYKANGKEKYKSKLKKKNVLEKSLLISISETRIKVHVTQALNNWACGKSFVLVLTTMYYARFEVFRTFLRLQASLGFSHANIHLKCTSRHIFSVRWITGLAKQYYHKL